MTATLLSPLPKLRFVDSNGNALSGGKLFTYSAGTTTKLATYTDSTGGTPNTNPVILDTRGEASVWLTPGVAYKFTLSPSTDSDPPTNSIWTVDQITISSQAATLPVFRDWLAGMTLSNDGTSPNTVLDISAGQATDSTNTYLITLGAWTKATGGTWVAGSGQNGMGTGLTIANSTWYHVFAIINNGSADVYYDTSVTAANAPANTTAFRRIGSFKTDSSAHIIQFVQAGDFFQWNFSSPALDVNATNPGTSAVMATANVPTGVNVVAMMNFVLQVNSTSTTGGVAAYVSDLSTPDFVPAGNVAPLAQIFASVQAANNFAAVQVQVRTNTSGQFRYRLSGSDAQVAIRGMATGWFDTRGRFA